MSKKIEIPQELMNQIIDCYVNQQLSLQKTIAKLNLPYSVDVVKRSLKEQGVHIRTHKEAACTGLRGPIPPEIEKQILDLYDKGFSIARIQRELQKFYSTDKITKVLTDNKVKIRTLEEAKKCQIETEERKYLVNDKYCLESHNGAWILGIFASDGYLPVTNGAHNRLVLSLAKKDEEVLYMIAKELEYEGPLHSYLASDHVHEFTSLSFTSKILRQQFEKYGIVNNKTFKLNILPNIPDEFMIDFIRGYVDGDGSIVDDKGSLVIRITCASKLFLQDMQKYIKEHYNIESKIRPDHDAFDLCFGAQASKKLGNLMYNNDYLALPRKKEKFFEIIAPKSLDIPQG